MPDDIDTIFHLAANFDISKGATDTSIDFQNTTIATYNLIEVMRIKNIKHIFYTSGSGVYGDVGLTYTSPVSMYGATKFSAEALISVYTHLYNMKAWIVVPANLIGPRSTHGVIFDFIKKLRNSSKELQIFGDGKQGKSYLYIDDVIDAFFLIWEKSRERINLYNLTSNDFITVTDIAHIVAKAMGYKQVKFI